MPQPPRKSGNILSAFAFGLVLGSALMITPVLAIIIMAASIAGLILWHLPKS